MLMVESEACLEDGRLIPSFVWAGWIDGNQFMPLHNQRDWWRLGRSSGLGMFSLTCDTVSRRVSILFSVCLSVLEDPEIRSACSQWEHALCLEERVFVTPRLLGWIIADFWVFSLSFFCASLMFICIIIIKKYKGWFFSCLVFCDSISCSPSFLSSQEWLWTPIVIIISGLFGAGE